MGYDIEMVVEARQDGVWVVVAEPPIDPVRRDYQIWVALGLEDAADWSDPVYQAPIVSARGLPADAADKTRSAWEERVDAGMMVGASWFTLEELIWQRHRLDGIVGDVIDQMFQHGTSDAVRLVFWFVP